MKLFGDAGSLEGSSVNLWSIPANDYNSTSLQKMNFNTMINNRACYLSHASHSSLSVGQFADGIFYLKSTSYIDMLLKFQMSEYEYLNTRANIEKYKHGCFGRLGLNCC